MSTQPESQQAKKAEQFLALHHGDAPLLLPNPWDVGSAKILAAIGFSALATTSAGFAGTLGRLDGGVTRDEVMEHARAIAAATDLPVSADLENCFAHEPAGVAETMGLAIGTGLVGGSVEDYGATARSTTPDWPSNGWQPQSRPLMEDRFILSSRPGARTTYTAGGTSTTRSPGSWRTRRPGPMCSMRRA